MGTTSQNYVSITPLLHIGTGVPFEHIKTPNVFHAIDFILNGQTVVVPADSHAEIIMVMLGVQPSDARRRIARARNGEILTDDPFEVTDAS